MARLRGDRLRPLPGDRRLADALPSWAGLGLSCVLCLACGEEVAVDPAAVHVPEDARPRVLVRDHARACAGLSGVVSPLPSASPWAKGRRS